jgi:hypothetical protein
MKITNKNIIRYILLFIIILSYIIISIVNGEMFIWGRANRHYYLQGIPLIIMIIAFIEILAAIILRIIAAKKFKEKYFDYIKYSDLLIKISFLLGIISILIYNFA